MWRFGVGIGFVLVLLLPAASVSDATARHTSPAKCPPGHTHLITADTQAQVYQVFSPEPAEIFGCAYGGKRSYLLGGPPVSDAEGGGKQTYYTLGGAVVAFASASFRDFPRPGEPRSENYVEVLNLGTGRVLHKVPTGTSSPSRVGFGAVAALLVKSDGAVAWIAGNNLGDEHPTSFEVHAVDKADNRLLASGPEIDPSSLALAGSTLYWTQGGKPMFTSLN